jgi:hypothetical protein
MPSVDRGCGGGGQGWWLSRGAVGLVIGDGPNDDGGVSGAGTWSMGFKAMSSQEMIRPSIGQPTVSVWWRIVGDGDDPTC